MDETIAEMRAWALSIQRDAAKLAAVLDGMRPSASAPKLFSVRELAKEYGVPASTLYDAVRRGDLRSTTPKGYKNKLFIKKEWFEEWLGVDER